jgi:hypothetical protein
MRSGRFLIVIAGDGIREDVSGIAELINRNASSAFSFALVEVALYGFDDSSLAIQPRVIARTQIIERTVVVVRDANQPLEVTASEDADTEESGASAVGIRNELGESPEQAQYRIWWTPVMNAPFDDPDQEPARLYYPNNVRVTLPWPTKVWAGAYRVGGESGSVGVGTNGQEPGYSNLISALERQKAAILDELPGAVFKPWDGGKKISISTQRRAAEFTTDDEMRRWLSSTLNAYVNALRPRLKALVKEQRFEMS